MPTSVIGAAAAPVVGAAVGSLFGGGGAQAEVPDDLRNLRSEQIDLMRYLLGYGNLNQPTAFTGPTNPYNLPYLSSGAGPNADPFSGGNPFTPGAPGGFGSASGIQTPWGTGANPFAPQAPASGGPNINTQSTGGMTPGGAPATPPGTGGFTPSRPSLPGAPSAPPTGGMTPGGTPGTSPGALGPGQRLEQFFGPLGMPQSPLQQQAVGNISTFLSDANSPFNRTQQQSFDVLGNILGSNPGQPVIDALQPSFQRNLAEANQQGGRFGTSNAVLRSRALDDFNLLAAQAAQQGVNQQMQAANLGNILGNDQLARLAGIFGIGGQQAQQNDVETQRRIQLLQSILATSQGAALGQPVSVQPSGAQQGLQAGLSFASLLPFLLNQGGSRPA